MNRGIEVLQTCALPLGHGAVQFTLYYYNREFFVCQEGKEFFEKFLIFMLAILYYMQKAHSRSRMRFDEFLDVFKQY